MREYLINIMKNIFRTAAAVLFLCTAVFSAAGCGNDKALDDYRSSMDEYYNEVSSYNDAINDIDPKADDAGDQLLKQLDGLNDATAKMAALDVPEQFSSVEELADDAADYMNKAVTLYHQAYSADPYDPDLADEGRQYYERANKRIVYILKILHGEAPQETESTSETDTDITESTAGDTAEDASAGTTVTGSTSAEDASVGSAAVSTSSVE